MKNRIALLHFAAPPVVGGVESTIYHHARLLAQAGYDVHVIAGRGDEFHPDVRFHHIPEMDSRHPVVQRIGDSLAAGSISPEFRSFQDHLIDKLIGLLQEFNVCIVHNIITLHKNLPLTAALNELNNTKITRLIAWCHDFAWRDELYISSMHSGYPWDLLRTAWPGVLYVAVSYHRRKKLAELLGLNEDRIHVVTPGVDVYEFMKLEPLTRWLGDELNLLKARPLILLPARITRRKNIEFAIQVTAALKKNTLLPTLLVTGPPGPHNPKNITYLKSLKALRDELGLKEQVHFLYEFGEDDHPLRLTDDVISDLYRLADILLFPSLREGFGIPVLEGGLARIPVFASEIPPVRESSGENVELFDPKGDANEVANAIRKHLMDDRAYRLRRRVVENYSWQRILEKDLIPLIGSSTQ